MNEKAKYGNYSILKIVDQVRHDECCNVGAILFDENGQNCGYKADTNERALRMGIMQPEWAEHSNILDFERRLKGMQNMDQLTKTLESMGHAMSYIQFRNPLPTLLYEGCLESIFNSFVLGKRREQSNSGL
jgi:hypothetical protein